MRPDDGNRKPHRDTNNYPMRYADYSRGSVSEVAPSRLGSRVRAFDINAHSALFGLAKVINRLEPACMHRGGQFVALNEIRHSCSIVHAGVRYRALNQCGEIKGRGRLV